MVNVAHEVLARAIYEATPGIPWDDQESDHVPSEMIASHLLQRFQIVADNRKFWTVDVADGNGGVAESLLVRGNTKGEARAEAKTILGLDKLPDGSVVRPGWAAAEVAA